jgi:5-methylcytosine-specific restriction endonuclease McrA
MSERLDLTGQKFGRLTVLEFSHIDYNKKNCCPENLVTLCKRCHSKTNTNRGVWIEFFKR